MNFVADRFGRTKKMLEAMGLGKQIVTPLWLESCDQAGMRKFTSLEMLKRKNNMSVSLSQAIITHPLLMVTGR